MPAPVCGCWHPCDKRFLSGGFTRVPPRSRKGRKGIGTPPWEVGTGPPPPLCSGYESPRSREGREGIWSLDTRTLCWLKDGKRTQRFMTSDPPKRVRCFFKKFCTPPPPPPRLHNPPTADTPLCPWPRKGLVAMLYLSLFLTAAQTSVQKSWPSNVHS